MYELQDFDIGTNKGIYSHVKRFIGSAVRNYGKSVVL